MADILIDALALFTRKRTGSGTNPDDPRFKGKLEQALGRMAPDNRDGFLVEIEALRAVMVGTVGTPAERAMVIRIAKKYHLKDKLTGRLAKKLGNTGADANRPFETLLTTPRDFIVTTATLRATGF